MGCCFRFLVFSSDTGFIAHRLYAYKRIFQVSREREKRMRKFFMDMFTSYSLFFPIWHCSIYLLCLSIIFWLHLCRIELILIVLISLFSCAICVWFFLNFYLWFHLFSIVGIWFPFHCIFRWDVIFLFSSFHQISVSLPNIYKRLTGFFRFLGGKSSGGGSTSSISLLRIPCSLLYRIVRYLCYFLVLFVDLVYVW